ncbi:protein kinase [Streptosporangium sp. NBC_01810]|uniref:serine/threonine-protein kinase n=1 Tax=Streptosporangium sp. NBC_01810 TaxID=2975951 RepID=UPI002DD7BCFB|nr:serine/threonine-protein kinase [Streptosporangium sp. NBC_01810]WSA26053.1 protein kinase [Streptosporangium sp. NBC_01810]
MNRPGVEGLRSTDPESIGAYRLLGRLGEGGMGTVYLALAPAGRPVALKVVKAELTVEDGFAARFHAEVENARRVASFCTAQVLDDGTDDDDRLYMVTEYIAGTPLSRQISEHGALEPGTLHGVALGVAAALAAIHVAGLVHRDLKPANVILSMSGPRVIDFGIARALDSTHSFTRSGEVLGSPGWWAPEQIQGLDITPAADIFAWGCMVAYAGNGRHPYGRGDLMTMATRLLNSPPDLGALPAPLNDLVRRATAMDPYRRPTAQDLLIALVGGGIAAPPSPAPARTDPPTLIASDLLHESWQPPANVEPDSTQTLSALNLGTRFPAPPSVQGPATPATASSTSAPPPPGPSTTPTPLDFPPPSRAESATSPSQPLTGPVPAQTAARTAARTPAQTAARTPAQTAARTPALPPPGIRLPPESDAPDTGGTAPRRRWLFAGLAVLAALAVTVVVLLNLRGPDPGDQGETRAGSTGVTRGAAGTGGNGGTGGIAGNGATDVGRRITTGSFLTDPQLIIPRTPTCGLTAYEGATPVRGRLCTIPWTLVNTGGEAARLSRTPLTLLDDVGTAHTAERASTELPATLPPGAKVDGVLVYDLPTSRKPAKLTGTVIEGGGEIEVRVS